MVASRAASARDRFPTGSPNASIGTLAILTVPAARLRCTILEDQGTCHPSQDPSRAVDVPSVE